jgi:hypothetical protein
LTEEAKIVLAVSGIIAILVILFSVVVVTLAPAILIIFGMWDTFAYWYPIAMLVGRFFCVFGFIVGIVYTFLGKMVYLVSGVIDLIMAIWGIPVLQTAVMSLGYTQLSGMDLQRTILTIILIESIMVSGSLIAKKSE